MPLDARPADLEAEQPAADAVEDSYLPVLETVRPSQQTAAAPSLAESLHHQSLGELIESYLRYYAAGRGHTARAKQYDLQHFLEFLSRGRTAVPVQVAQWTMQSTKDFIDDRLALGEAPATVARRLATIKHFGRTLAERVPGFINPAREVKTPVIQPGRPQGLSDEEIRLLRQAAAESCSGKKPSFLAVRNKFLLELLLSTGLRADEVRLLVMAQISEERTWLKNVKTKGRKFRNVYLDTQVREQLEVYLAAREEQVLRKVPGHAQLSPVEAGRLPVFVSLYQASFAHPNSFGLGSKTIWRVIAAFGSRARIISGKKLPNLHPHVLRHTFAHGLLDTTNDVRLVAQALGHSDVRITMRYTERTDEELARAIEKKTSRER